MLDSRYISHNHDLFKTCWNYGIDSVEPTEATVSSSIAYKTSASQEVHVWLAAKVT